MLCLGTKQSQGTRELPLFALLLNLVAAGTFLGLCPLAEAWVNQGEVQSRPWVPGARPAEGKIAEWQRLNSWPQAVCSSSAG